MNTLEAVQQKLRENDPIKIIRGWVVSAFIGEDSKARSRNPDYHAPVYQTETGKFVDIEGRPLPASRVPAYVREEGKTLLRATPAAPQREMTMAEAMNEADRRAARANDPSPESVQPRRRGRPRKAS